MPKGKMSGSPTNIVCWLLGGYFDDTVWGVAYDRDNLLDEITMLHYENPRAKAAGVKILGITQATPDDVHEFEVYKRVYFQDEPPAFAIYICEEAKLMEAYEDDPETFLEVFTHSKGYDLPPENLDPTNMPGEPRKISL